MLPDDEERPAAATHSDEAQSPRKASVPAQSRAERIAAWLGIKVEDLPERNRRLRYTVDPYDLRKPGGGE